MKTFNFKLKDLECVLYISGDTMTLKVPNSKSNIMYHFIYARSKKLLINLYFKEPFADIQDIGYREAKLVITDWILEYAMGR